MPKGIYNHYKIKGKKKPHLSKKMQGNGNINYVDGRYSKLYYCSKCDKKISIFSGVYGSGLCISCSRKGLFDGRKNPRFGKIAKHGKRIKYKGIWMRSSWEVLYAKWLDKYNIIWTYESKIFDLGKSTYRPDFYLPNINKYIEIKGFWRNDAEKKFKLFKELYSNIEIEVLRKKELQSMGIL